MCNEKRAQCSEIKTEAVLSPPWFCKRFWECVSVCMCMQACACAKPLQAPLYDLSSNQGAQMAGCPHLPLPRKLRPDAPKPSLRCSASLSGWGWLPGHGSTAHTATQTLHRRKHTNPTLYTATHPAVRGHTNPTSHKSRQNPHNSITLTLGHIAPATHTPHYPVHGHANPTVKHSNPREHLTAQ